MNRNWQNSTASAIATATILGVGADVVWTATLLAITVNVFEREWISLEAMAALCLLSPMLLFAVWLQFCVLVVMSLVLATVCYFHQRRYRGIAPAMCWFFFVLLMGAPGAVGYWLHRRWPPVERCRHCDRDAPRDRETCLYCGAEFPTPPATDVDIRGPVDVAGGRGFMAEAAVTA